jgi:hypothetical protein
MEAGMTSIEAIKQDLDKLNSEQLQKVADFIDFLKFGDRQHRQIRLNPTQLATIFTEFSEEDRVFTEMGMSDYAVMLAQEDEL